MVFSMIMVVQVLLYKFLLMTKVLGQSRLKTILIGTMPVTVLRFIKAMLEMFIPLYRVTEHMLTTISKP